MSEAGEGGGGTRGRFTRMFDHEFISDALARREQEFKDEAELAAVDRDERTTRRLEVASSIAERFHSRRDQLSNKFPGMVARTTEDALGVSYQFPPAQGQAEGARLEFEVEVSHSGAALHIHSRGILGGKTAADRISMAERKVDLARVERFVERKILDFVRRYLGDE